MIVSFVQTKGGTGKSTLSINLAFSKILSNKYNSIALVDLDAQGTILNWWKEREENNRRNGKVSFHSLSSTQKGVLQDGISAIAAHNELVIMDIPGESTSKLHTRFACACSDMVVIPMRTSTNDESAFAENLYPIIKEIGKVAPEKRGNFHVLPAFIHPNTHKEGVIDYFEDILPKRVGCMDAIFPFRAVYENYNRDGLNLNEYAKEVKNNSYQNKQVLNAVSDTEEIAKAILKKTEE